MKTSVVTHCPPAMRIELLDMAAFAAIYFLWGGTFLAIRIAVLELPPLLTSGTRFFVAGLLLYGLMRLRGHARPPMRQWRDLACVGMLMFVVTYGPLFWAVQYVTSSMTAVLEATLPITAICLEMLVFRTQPLQWRVALGVVVGFLGVLLLLVQNAGQHLAPLPCLVILGAGIAWSTGAVLSKRLALPASRPLTAGAQMMLGGGILLTLSVSSGEMHPFPHVSLRAALALLYLVVFGSLIAYTAYVWLIGRYSATRVSSHAYVNPLVAVALGHFVAGEVITTRSMMAFLVIVASVLLILAKSSAPSATATEPRRGFSATGT